MARSFANVKVLSALVQNEFPLALTLTTRRGYAAAAATTQSTKRGAVASMGAGEEKGTNTEKVSWVPDPVTGYYKPENIKEIDPADLRATLLRNKFFN